MAEAIVLTAPQKMALMTMESKAKQTTSLDLFNEFTKMNFPKELVTAFKDLSFKTFTDVTGQIINVGKILVLQIIEFINKNTGLSIGLLIGASIIVITASIPFLGPVLGTIGMIASTLAGHHLDKNLEIDNGKSFYKSIPEDIITLSKEFFLLLGTIFKAIFKPEKLQKESTYNQKLRQQKEELNIVTSAHQVSSSKELSKLEKEFLQETDIEKLNIIHKKMQGLQESLSVVNNMSNTNSNEINITNVSSNSNTSSATSTSRVGDDTTNNTNYNLKG
jgi:hypothetical protein